MFFLFIILCNLEIIFTFSTSSSKNVEIKVCSFGMGCFWKPQEYWQDINGIIDVKVGYQGGLKSQNPPTYKQVCSGTTKHVETVRIEYDDNVISYKDLLYKFYNYSGELLSNASQYSAVIFTHSNEQKIILENVIQELEEEGNNNRVKIPIVKEASIFYPAERYHDRFWKKQNLRNFLLISSILSQYLSLPPSIYGEVKLIAGIIPIGYVILFLFERFIEPRDDAITP